MAETTITTNGNGGKESSESGNEVRFGHSPDVIMEREKMEAELKKKVIEPLALLAGVLASIKDEEDESSGCDKLVTLGYLLGLIVNGIRKEVNFQVYGLNKEALLEMILQKGFEQDLFGKGNAA